MHGTRKTATTEFGVRVSLLSSSYNGVMEESEDGNGKATTVLSGAEERVAEERPGWNFQIF